MALSSRNIYRGIFLTSVDSSDCLAAHNEKRAMHVDTSALEWDTALAQEAKQWVDELLELDPLELVHSSNGELLYASMATAVRSCRDAVNGWSVSQRFHHSRLPLCRAD